MAGPQHWDAARGCLCGEQATFGANVQGRIEQRPARIFSDKTTTAMSCGWRLSNRAQV